MRLEGWPASAAVRGRKVTWTVVSVIPYMFTRRGAASPKRWNQGRREAGSRASPPKTIQRSGGTEAAVPATGMSWRNAEGVWLSTVTPSATRSSQKRSGERLTQYGTTTSRPPKARAPQISQTEKSNAKEWKRVQTSSGPKAKRSADAARRWATLAWVTGTPFGRPVEPEV